MAHLHVFGAKCWAKIPSALGSSKLDPRSSECQLLGYALGSGNYKVQDVTSKRVFVSRDVVFEEGWPRCTSMSVGEQLQIPLFDADITGNNVQPIPAIIDDHHRTPVVPVDQTNAGVDQNAHQQPIPAIPVEQRRSTRMPQPSQAGLQSTEYRQRENAKKGEGHDWATDCRHPQASCATDWPTLDLDNIFACLADSRASHYIPCSYRDAIATDPDRWTIPMQAEMETLKVKHTWDLVTPPPGANIMDSMWIYNIKWDGEGNHIKDKARLVGKGYTQQLGVDYNETWAAVT